MSPYTIYYRKPSNPCITRFRNEQRNVSAKIVPDVDSAKEFLAHLAAKGYELIHVYSYTGKKISFDTCKN